VQRTNEDGREFMGMSHRVYGKAEGKRSLERHSPGWEYIKMGLSKIEWYGLD
jgi:hypothetical protein